MRKAIVVCVLLIGSIGFAQKPTTTIDSISKFRFYFIDNSSKFKADDISYLKNFNYSTKTTLSVYNPLTGFNQNYIKEKDSYSSTRSNMTKYNVWSNERKDSFNPSGSQNIGTTLVFGVLNSIFR